MTPDEKWAAVPPTTTTPWGITIRRADGSYREPTQEEIDGLLRSRNATSADHQKLRELAEAATPGPWTKRPWPEFGVDGPQWPICIVEQDDDRRPLLSEDKSAHDDEDAAFIAAANPQTVIAVLDDNERLTEQLAAANAEVERLKALAGDFEAQRHETALALIATETQRDVARQQLAAMTKARDEACDIVSRMLALAVRSPDDFSGVFARIESLRKVGQ